MFGFFIRRPLHAGVIVGLIVAIVFGLVSFPSEGSLDKTIDDWLPENGVTGEAEINELIAALEEARAGDGTVESVSESRFQDLDLERTYAFPTARSDAFEIEYVGQTEPGSDTVYVATREVYAAPWWHPDRLLYRAAGHHVDAFGSGLRLTYERDWDGLGALLLMDAIVGVVYGAMISLILAVLGGTQSQPPKGAGGRQLPAEASMAAFKGGKFVGRPTGWR
jgi:hypothetical protein